MTRLWNSGRRNSKTAAMGRPRQSVILRVSMNVRAEGMIGTVFGFRFVNDAFSDALNEALEFLQRYQEKRASVWDSVFVFKTGNYSLLRQHYFQHKNCCTSVPS